MKTYFPDDPIKQELLEGLITAYRMIEIHECDYCSSKCRSFDDGCDIRYIRLILEKVTGESIRNISQP